MSGMRDILDLSPAQLTREFEKLGREAFRARQVVEWVFRKRATAFREMTSLPADLRTELAGTFRIGSGEVEEILRSETGATSKVLLRLGDDARVEAVSMRSDRRHTACLSSQVGCAMACTFCATGGMRFARNLSSGEMLLQVLALERSEGSIERVVFMGMGEPLLNLPGVLGAVEALMDAQCFGLGGRRITVSTCGIVPGIREMARRDVPVHLALSLNSPFQDVRKKMMPVSERYPLDRVIAACEEYTSKTRRRLTLEYVLLKDTNISRRDASEVARIALRLDAKVNLIQYNPVDGAPFHPPTAGETTAFRNWLEHAGVKVTVRYRRGRDIRAGCGQLATARARATRQA